VFKCKKKMKLCVVPFSKAIEKLATLFKES